MTLLENIIDGLLNDGITRAEVDGMIAATRQRWPGISDDGIAAWFEHLDHALTVGLLDFAKKENRKLYEAIHGDSDGVSDGQIEAELRQRSGDPAARRKRK
jgi:hypothetical protein